MRDFENILKIVEKYHIIVAAILKLALFLKISFSNNIFWKLRYITVFYINTMFLDYILLLLYCQAKYHIFYSKIKMTLFD